MANSKSKPRVLIIGAGLGGMALAQSLRKRGVDSQIFERDEHDGARSQGWAISLHEWFIRDLLAATCDDMPNLEPVGVTYELGIPGEGAIFDAHDMTEKTRFGAAVGQHFIRADRAKLREWLLTNLKHVYWGKKFTHYEQNEEGVTAFFDDGTSYTGDVLVGADGVSSQVRQQLLAGSDIQPEYRPAPSIIGEFDATEEQCKRWMKLAPSFFIGSAHPRRIFVGLKSISPDQKTARYYWIFNWTDKEAEKESYWTSSASQQEMHDFVLKNLLDDIHPTFVEIIRSTPVQGILHPTLRLRDMIPPELPRGRITLLGDSIHPMVPFKGEGGNIAMKDGFNLASILDPIDSQPVEDMLKAFESEMIPRATNSVLSSRANGGLV